MNKNKTRDERAIEVRVGVDGKIIWKEYKLGPISERK